MIVESLSILILTLTTILTPILGFFYGKDLFVQLIQTYL